MFRIIPCIVSCFKSHLATSPLRFKSSNAHHHHITPWLLPLYQKHLADPSSQTARKSCVLYHDVVAVLSRLCHRRALVVGPVMDTTQDSLSSFLFRCVIKLLLLAELEVGRKLRSGIGAGGLDVAGLLAVVADSLAGATLGGAVAAQVTWFTTCELLASGGVVK